jgi:hypothetical protein
VEQLPRLRELVLVRLDPAAGRTNFFPRRAALRALLLIPLPTVALPGRAAAAGDFHAEVPVRLRSRDGVTSNRPQKNAFKLY